MGPFASGVRHGDRAQTGPKTQGRRLNFKAGDVNSAGFRHGEGTPEPEETGITNPDDTPRRSTLGTKYPGKENRGQAYNQWLHIQKRKVQLRGYFNICNKNLSHITK